MLEVEQTNGSSQVSSRSSQLSQSAVTVTDDNDRIKKWHMDGASKKEMLEFVQTNGHNQNLPFITHPIIRVGK